MKDEWMYGFLAISCEILVFYAIKEYDNDKRK